MAEEMNLPVRQRGQTGKKQFPLVSFDLGCHQKMPPTFRVGLPASDNLSDQENISQKCPAVCVLVYCRYNKVDNQD